VTVRKGDGDGEVILGPDALMPMSSSVAQLRQRLLEESGSRGITDSGEFPVELEQLLGNTLSGVWETLVGLSMGADLTPVEIDGTTGLRVGVIAPVGRLEDWNRDNVLFSVHRGDFIMEVNGVRGEGIVEEIKKADALMLKVRTGPPKADEVAVEKDSRVLQDEESLVSLCSGLASLSGDVKLQVVAKLTYAGHECSKAALQAKKKDEPPPMEAKRMSVVG